MVIFDYLSEIKICSIEVNIVKIFVFIDNVICRKSIIGSG